MFIGEYNHAIDEKGRLAIPVKFRSRLAKAVVTRGLDFCLVVYELKEWKKLADKLAALPQNHADNRAFARLMLAGAMDVAVDGQGRVVVPEYLREFAKLGREVVIAGLYNRLEIWDKAAWTEYKNRTEKDSNQIAERLGELGT